MISCPLPDTNTDLISAGHGSGGLMTQRLLQRAVFSILGNEWLDRQHDGAFLDLGGPVAFSTDTYVISPIFFPGGNIGDLAVNGTVNDLAMCGAAAEYLSLGLVLEEGLPVGELEAVLRSVRSAADRAGVHIVTGDTKVVEKGKGDRMFINTSGLGPILPGASIDHRRIEAGDRLIVSGSIANHGVAVLSVREGLSFETQVVSDTQPLKEAVRGLVALFGEGVKFLRDPTRGGVASVLNEVAGITGMGFRLEQEAIPVAEEVAGACEMLGLDPLYVANEGIFLAVVRKEIASAAVDYLRALPGPSALMAGVIGEASAEARGKVVLRGEIGGSRIVGPLVGEQLPRIC